MLIEKAAERKKIISEMKLVNYQLSTFDSTYSDANEFPFTKVQLTEKLNNLSVKLKEIEKF